MLYIWVEPLGLSKAIPKNIEPLYRMKLVQIKRK